MPILIRETCELAATLATVSGFAYALISIFSAQAFVRERNSPSPSQFAPPVSILKPLKGADPAMYESFRSHCLQSYPQYEIIFGVSDLADPAIPFVEKLQAEFPTRAIKLVTCPENFGPNTKVSNLEQMLRHAQHDILIVNDSDIRVPPDYLRRVVDPLANAQVALVTCLYRGIPGASLGSRLEALGITDFAAGVLAARQLEGGIRFGLGSTLAFRRADLMSAGGFAAFSDYLADDYQIGAQLVGDQRKGILSAAVVETYLPTYTFTEYVTHQLRWARAVRDSRPWGYVGLLLTYYLLWACLATLCSGGAPWAWALLASAAILRITSVIAVGGPVLNDRGTLPRLHLIPLRDLLALPLWLIGLMGRRILWRGESFILKAGKLTRTP